MDGHQNATAVSGGQATKVSGGQGMTVSGYQPSSGFPAEMAPSMGSSSMTLEFIPGDNMEGSDDANHEWLSLLVEDCLSSTSCYPAFPLPPTTTITVAPSLPIRPPIQECVAQSISRAKRSKLTPTIVHVTPYDPPLLHQPHWLADSELIYPRKEEHEENNQLLLPPQVVPVGEEEQQQPRRCSHCQSQRTPQWRAGPLGPKTLCNACGVRFKSGRLLPEYRPAKSPTFVSYKHSNSHKKVLEMRMGFSPQIPSE